MTLADLAHVVCCNCYASVLSCQCLRYGLVSPGCAYCGGELGAEADYCSTFCQLSHAAEGELLAA